jgi:Holliday junction resolvase RusA-like endonuclease
LIHLYVPSLPPSVNAAYFTTAKRKGKVTIPIRVLTPEGKRYKAETKGYIAQHYPSELKFFQPNKPLCLLIKFTFEGFDSLHNKTWPKEAKSRYKKLDVSNRLKIFEDAVSAATGLDDSQNFMVSIVKVWGKEEGTDLWAWNLEEEGSPYFDYLHQLQHGARQAKSH